MSSFFPRADYAEDQSLAHTILITHTMHRGFTTGAIIGIPIGLFKAFRTPAGASRLLPILRASATGSVIGTGFLAVATVGRMWGREEIEWKDRAYRLLYNKGQVEVDKWCLGGTALGAVWAAVGRGRNPILRVAGWKGVVGGAALGSVAGTVGYMVWRYGVKGGKFEAD